MPRIRRWHPVSHDFNRDPEVQDLRHAFGQWMGYVWLEMLSIADRNNGQIKGDRAQVARGLAWLSLSDRPSYSRGKIEVAIQYMIDKGWVEEGTGCLLVRNYSEYHRIREHKKPREGTLKAPLLSEPILSEPILKEEVLSAEPAQTAGSTPPPSRNGFDPDLKVWLLGSKHLQPLADDKHTDFWDLLVKAYDRYPWLYFEEQITKADAWIESNGARAPTPRGLRRFMRSWLERAVEFGRKQHG